MRKLTRLLSLALLVVSMPLLMLTGSIRTADAAPSDDPAVAAFERGKDAFIRRDFVAATREFNGSYRQRPHPLTAYFLCLAYNKLNDFTNAKHWAGISLTPTKEYVLKAEYSKGAKDIINFANARLSPPPPPTPSQDGIGLSASAVTSPPSPPVPNEVPPERKNPAAAARVPAGALRGGDRVRQAR